MALRRSRVDRGPRGAIRITLPVGERSFLDDLARQLRKIVSDVDPTVPPDELRARLFPRAYEDPLDQNEYADQNTGPLAEAKRTALDTFLESLADGSERGGLWRIDLAREQVDAWLAVLNDGRLVLGKLAGIEDEDDWEMVRASEDDTGVLLDYLSMLQEGLLGLLLGRD